jgi:hypothetical protein
LSDDPLPIDPPLDGGYERAHHRRIARVLRCFNAAVLDELHVAFGGGTAIALLFGEFRESVDVDFLVSDIDGYRRLRTLVTGPSGLTPLLHAQAPLAQRREVRADAYGVRTVVAVDDVAIKLEVIFEARIALAPAVRRVCGVPTLEDVDLVASKLLANSDRAFDDAVFSRDLIDLALMRPPRRLFASALEKAKRPYGDAVARDLRAAVSRMQARPGRLQSCLTALQMTSTTPAQAWAAIRRLPRLLPDA